MNKRNNRYLAALAFLAIVVITVLAYYPGMSAGFYFDDETNFIRVPAMHWTEFSVEALHRTMSETWENSRVVANVSFAVTHLISGLDPAPYHWTNLLIHLAAGSALFWVIRLLQYHHVSKNGNPWIVLLVVFVFLVHPLNIQAVTYVVQRMTSMAALFFLLAFGSYLTGRHNCIPARRYAWFALTILFLLFSIGSKEIGYLLLPLLVVYEIAFHPDEWRAQLTLWLSPKRRAGAIGALAATFLLACFVLWHLLEGRIYWSETVPGFEFTGYERALTQGRVQLFYISLLLWPASSRLNLDHDFLISTSLFSPISTSLSLGIGLAIVGWAIWNLRSRPLLAFPVLGYFLLHSIESAPLNLDLVFEHRMYMPMTMLAIFAALNIESLPKPIIRISYFALITIGLLLSISTYQRNVVWSDRIAFLRDTAQKSPNKFRPQYNLGTELGRHGLFVEAKLPLQKAAVLRPNDSEVHNQLANIFMKEKQTGEAEKHYRLAIANDDANAEALYNLAMLLGSQQRYTEQKIILEQFILKAPPYLDKQKRWATQYLRQ